MFRSIKVIALLVIVLLVTICHNQPVNSVIVKSSDPFTNIGNYKDRIIGCLFSDVCTASEICFDDNAFGRCEEWDIRTGSYSSNFVYQIDRKTLQLLEQELNRLNEENYTWKDAYTQCILKAVLNDRPRIVYNPNKCESFRYVSSIKDNDADKQIYLAINRFLKEQNKASNDQQQEEKEEEEEEQQQQQSPIIDENNLNDIIDINSLTNDLASPLSSLLNSNTNLKTPKVHNSFNYPKTVNSVIVSQVEKPSHTINNNNNNNNQNKNKCQSFNCIQRKAQLLLNTKKLPIDPNSVNVDDEEWKSLSNSIKDDLINQQKLLKKKNNSFKRFLFHLNGKNNNNGLDAPEAQSDNVHDNFDINSLGNDNLRNNIELINELLPNDRVLREVNDDDNQSIKDNEDSNDVAVILVNKDSPTSIENDDGTILFNIFKKTVDANENDDEDNDTTPLIIDNVDNADDNVLIRDIGNDNGIILDDDVAGSNGVGDGVDDDDDKNKDAIEDKEMLKEMLFGDINYSNNNDEEEKPSFNRMHRYDIKKPGPRYIEEYFFENFSSKDSKRDKDGKQLNDEKTLISQSNSQTKPTGSLQKKETDFMSTKPVAEGPVKVDGKSTNILIIRSANKGEETSLEAIDSTHTYVITDKILGEEESQKFLQTLEQIFKLPRGTFSNSRKEGNQLTFKVNPNYRELNASQVASRIEDLAKYIRNLTGFLVRESGIGNKTKLPVISPSIIREKNKKLISLTLMTCSIVLAFIMAAFIIFLFRRNATFRGKLKLFTKNAKDFSFDYQDLYKKHMKKQNDSEKGNNKKKGNENEKLKNVDTNLANQQGHQEVQASPPSRSLTSSWVEEPVSSNMDITTGHIILSYMEDHLKKKDRLEKEWEALCAYEADPCSTNAALQKQNANKNRYNDVLPFDHSRVILDDLNNANNSDYINANTITDHDPRNPAYIATQGPMANTKADFWQMIWEQGSVIIVMLTRLRENGLSMCDRYWPEEGSEKFHNYEIHLVSEHIWCDDYLVRSFYLKNLKTGETRTVTQFHFLSWPDNGIPPNNKSILEFRRKINKSYKGRSCPIVVHCSDGIGRTGTYILIDMVLNRLAKGAKEIDIAATLEHIRDQRMGMVKTKAQLEFVLLAVAEEVQAILKALSQNN